VKIEIKKYVRELINYPVEGVSFKDITPILSNPEVFSYSLDLMEKLLPDSVECLASIESRGFLFGSVLSDRLSIPSILLRKKGKLPPPVFSKEYQLEYGIDVVEVGKATVPKGKNIMIIDDLIASGGSAQASNELLSECGNHVLGILVLIKLSYLCPENKFDKPIYYGVKYES